MLWNKRVVAAAAAVPLAVVIAACGSDEPQQQAGTSAPGTSQTSAPAAQAQFADADVEFLQEMYPHHAQAVQMAQAVPERSEDPQLIDLAARIEAAQEPEMEQMESLLAEWGQEAPDEDGMGHGGMGMPGGMPGMMSDDEWDSMMGARGMDFDRMWLTMMIAHHEGAIEMSQTELAEGVNPEARQLAESIIATQQAEIDEMRAMLEQ
ncbi:uncharacterized protein (DUF305 family) [Rhodococcus ruber]|uniref:Uncharacterized protein n=1 Tax=Rhodococcus ruber TaxID=1830 RepID=A0A098BQ79_9NOCA|nr:protein of unknown function DUF305 [Rhodococcus ruber]MBP2210111.1 uncharacterized protein (DUF305 family) [Rhodococcus ruber]CDZ90869.1 conserved exported hypothetical protein [Rhodococcus ruber]